MGHEPTAHGMSMEGAAHPGIARLVPLSLHCLLPTTYDLLRNATGT
jgi:hypothetical protein